MPTLVQEDEPREAVASDSHGRVAHLRLRGFATDGIAPTSPSFLKSDLADGLDLGVRRPAARDPGCGPPGRAGASWRPRRPRRSPPCAGASRPRPLRDDRRVAPVRELHEVTAVLEAGAQLRLVDRHALRGEAHVQAQPIDAARHAHLRADRRGAHRHLRQVVGDAASPTRPAARPMPCVQNAIASSPGASRPSLASSAWKRWLSSACTAAISAPTSRRTTCGRALRPAGGKNASGDGKPVRRHRELVLAVAHVQPRVRLDDVAVGDEEERPAARRRDPRRGSDSGSSAPSEAATRGMYSVNRRGSSDAGCTSAGER